MMNLIKIKRIIKILISLVLIPIFFISCKTNSSEKIVKEHLPEKKEMMVTNEEEQIPAYLWSKEEREFRSMYYYLLGESYYLNANPQKAREYFENSYNLENNPFVGAKILGIKTILGDDRITILEAKKLVLLYPKNAQLKFIYGLLLYKAGKESEAIQQIEKAVKLDPYSEMFSLNLAAIYEKKEELDKAQKVLEDLSINLPSSDKVKLYLTKIYLQSDQKEKALSTIRQAYELNNYSAEVILLYAIVLKSNGNSKEAIRMIDELYKLNPANDQITAKILEIYASIGDFNQAYDFIEDLLNTEEGKNNPSLLVQKVYILWQLQRNEEADDILENLYKSYPEQDKLIYVLGISKERINDLDEAIRVYSKINSKSEFWEYAILKIAILYTRQKNYKKALSYLDKIDLKDKEYTAQIIALKFSILDETKDYKRAVKEADNLYKTFPNKVDFLFYKGVYQEKLDDVKGAVSSFKKVMEINPKYSAAYNHLGYLYAERGINLEEAKTLLEQALILKPDDPYYLDSLGWVYYKLENYSEALKFLLKSESKLPNEYEVLYHIAETYMKMNQKKKALEYYNRILELKYLDEKDKVKIEKIVKTIN